MILIMAATHNWIKPWNYSNSMIGQVKISVAGQVQGVFFRGEAQKMAKRLNLTGLVRNQEDGSVKILAQGEETDLQSLIDWCHAGPQFAKVDKVEVKWEEVFGTFQGFMIE